jgi:hypothetical protein
VKVRVALRSLAAALLIGGLGLAPAGIDMHKMASRDLS